MEGYIHSVINNRDKILNKHKIGPCLCILYKFASLYINQFNSVSGSGD